MVETAAYGNRMAGYMHLASGPAITLKKLRHAPLAVTRLKSDCALSEKTTPIPPEKAWLVSVHLREASGGALWYHGRPEAVDSRRPEGGVTILDLEREPSACLGTAFDILQFYVPRTALDEIAEEHGATRIDTLFWPFAQVDPVVKHFAVGIMPAFEWPDCSNRLYLDHMILAAAAYFAEAYGGMTMRDPVRGGLAPWQLRRAKEMLSGNLDGQISLTQLANECALSRSHFARAFKQCTGTSPHRWLLGHRVEIAKQLLRQPGSSLAEIALGCGFADQSHFTRVFSGVVGMSPGAWRRAERE